MVSGCTNLDPLLLDLLNEDTRYRENLPLLCDATVPTGDTEHVSIVCSKGKQSWHGDRRRLARQLLGVIPKGHQIAFNLCEV